MESNGEPGKVNVSEAIFHLLKDDKNFTFQLRGSINAKGKGEIQMYFVEKI
ncbi:class 3 adenylate cyclase [Siphonobacter sp. SORGH_AS 1065]|nr:class 3 adenylate cyclase [Siphonobacter sp. SORGH_AS_1065]